MPFQFSTYSVDELRQCGAAFAADFAVFASDDTTARTLAVKRWFCDAMAPGLRCYGRPFDKEFLLDHCHTTFPFPQRGEHWSKRWERALGTACEMRLALESEWGKYNQPNESWARIMDDAWKVAIVRADVKVMVFASHGPSDRQRIVKGLSALRTRAADPQPWLWLDIPWDFSGTRPRDTAWGSFA